MLNDEVALGVANKTCNQISIGHSRWERAASPTAAVELLAIASAEATSTSTVSALRSVSLLSCRSR